MQRRQFLGRAAMTIAGASLFGMAETKGASRELNAIGRATEWINSARLSAEGLAGKAVLVDFCTYTCINWLRTLPYIRAWAQRYRPGLVVIGVHTPEFGFEQNVDHVRRALRQMKVEHPVVIDNDYTIWRAFDNHYWPARYIIDGRGRVRQHHFGEGDYDRSERTIQKLLADLGGGANNTGVVSVEGGGVEAAADWSSLKSPETYLGYDRTERFSSPGGGKLDRRRVYEVPGRLRLNEWALAGEWMMGRQAATLNSPTGRIICRFHARDLHLVMGPPPPQGSAVRFRVSIDGQPPGPARGLDVDQGGHGTIAEPRLYQLVRQPAPIVERQFQIEFLDPGAEAYAFTFG